MPKHASASPSTEEPAASPSENAGVASTVNPTSKAATTTETREATAADIERIDALTLEDFAADLSGVKIPESSPMSDQDMKIAVESYLSTLRVR
jgi:hypothetical protein